MTITLRREWLQEDWDSSSTNTIPVYAILYVSVYGFVGCDAKRKQKSRDERERERERELRQQQAKDAKLDEWFCVE